MLGGLSAFVVDVAVHQHAPIGKSGAHKADRAVGLQPRVHRDGRVRVGRKGLLICCKRLLVPDVEIDPRSDAGGDSAIEDGKFPVLAVVDLLRPDEDGGTGEQGPDADVPLVGHAAEELLEGEEPVGGVPLGGVARILVILGERLLPELCPDGERDSQQQADQDDSEASTHAISLSRRGPGGIRPSRRRN